MNAAGSQAGARLGETNMLARSKWMMAGIAALTAAVIWAVAAPAAQASAAEADTPPAVSATSPAAAEVEALQYMREEEKLARDVYLALYEEWQLPIFQTIAGSESQHMEAMLTLIEKYGLTDPAAGKAEGEFTNPELQALYAQLVAQGSKSAVDALKVGATIEDLDIADLMEALENMTSDDIRFAMENLLRGSENHLRAFMRNLERTGDTYEPQYLDAETFAEILEGQTGRMGARGRGARWDDNGRGRGMRWQ